MSDDLHDRIAEHTQRDPRELTPHPGNWRRHPDAQRRYVDAALREVGWVREPILNRTTGRLIDGHLRVEQAIAHGEDTIPVAVVELTEREEALALASHDAITADATTDDDALRQLLEDTSAEQDALQELIADLAPGEEAPEDESQEDDEEEDPTPMAERFLRPPFSIIDTRDAAWADRETQWDQAGVAPGEDLADSPALHELLITWHAGAQDTVHHLGDTAMGPRVARALNRHTDGDASDLVIAFAPQEVDDAWRAELAAAAQALHEDRFAVVVAPAPAGERPDERIKDVAAALGWRYYNEAVLIHEPEGGHPLPRAHRTAYIFVQGDPKAATEHIGPVDIQDVESTESP